MRFVFRERESLLSSINEVSRIFLFLSLFFLSVLFSNIELQLVVLCSILVTALAGGVLRDSLMFVKYSAYFSFFLFIVSIVFAPGGTVLFHISFFNLTASPLLFSFSMFLRIISSVLSLNLLLLAVNPDATMAFISRLGTKTAASLLVASRLMPVITNEGEEVLQAFESRGMSLRQGKWRERAKSASQIVYPLLYSTMDRSISVAEAMEARGFPSKWVKKRYVFTAWDNFQLAASAASIAGALWLSFHGTGLSDYYSGSSVLVQLPVAIAILLLTVPMAPILGRWSHHTDKGTDVQLHY